MEIYYKLSDCALEIMLKGELDESTASNVRISIDNHIAAKRVKRVVLDFSCMSFMDSTGVGVLIGRYRKFSENNVAFFITKPNPTIDKILKISGIYNIMPKIETA